MRKVRYKRLRVDMGGVWVSLLLLSYLVPGSLGFSDQSRPFTLQQLALVPGHSSTDVSMVSPLAAAWRVRHSRIGGVRRSERRTRSHYQDDPEPEDYENDENGSANQVTGEEEDDTPEESLLLLEQNMLVEEDDENEAPPDSTELRERHRVSAHENPPEPATKPNYTGEGQWARPPQHVAERIPFVPLQNYAQVRRYETELHLSPEDALSDAVNQEEVENAPRLREVVTHHKTQQVYSEEGYEDSAYDHGGYDKHGEHHEVAPGWEMTAVRLSGLAAKSHPDGASNEEEGGEEDEEEDDGDDHNAEGSDPRAKAVAAPNANETHPATKNEARGTWSIQNVLTKGKNHFNVADINSNFSKHTPFSTIGSLSTLAKFKFDRRSILNNSTQKPLGPTHLNAEELLRALKMKEKEHRLAQKSLKKWGREKKKRKHVSQKPKKQTIPSMDGSDIRDNEIKQPRSSKAKKLRKEQKRAERMKILKTKGKRNKALRSASLLKKGMQLNVSPSSFLGVQKVSILPVQVTKDANRTDLGPLPIQTTDAKSKRARSVKSVMKNPFSMYHRHPMEAVASVSDVPGLGKDVLETSLAQDITHSKLWEMASPWDSYGNGKRIRLIESENLFRPLPLGLLASTDSGENGGNDGLATVFQPIRSTTDGFLGTTGNAGAWGSLQKQRVGGKVEEKSLSTITKKPKFVLPGQGNLAIKFPKTEAILQMETRTLDKLKKTHNLKELPSNIKHVKPLIGVSYNKGSKLTAKQMEFIKDVGKKSHLNYKKGVPGSKRDSLNSSTESPLQDSTQNSTEPIAVTKNRAVYIANLTENYLTTKNFSWPPQVTLSPLTDGKMPLRIPQKGQRAFHYSVENVPHTKTHRNMSYHLKTKPHKIVSRRAVKLKRDKKPPSSDYVPELRIDKKKYPFYFASPSEHLKRYSPLRYAINPFEVPVKTGGGMEFYESREKQKKCKEVQTPEDPVPDRPSDGQWVQNTDGPDGPRISGLGEVISCLREKLFGKNPLDNPFFLETKVGLPADTSLVGAVDEENGSQAPEKTDEFEFYKDIVKQIDKTALRPFRSNVPDSPYVFIGSKSNSGSEEAQGIPVRHSATHQPYFKLHTSKEAPQKYFEVNRIKAKKIFAAQLEPKDGSESEEAELNHHEETPLLEPKKNQEYFNPPVNAHDVTAVDPHTPFKMSDDSKKYLDEFLNDLVRQKDSKEELHRDRSQTDAQETKLRIAHTDDIHQPAKASKMHPPALSKLKYRSLYTRRFNPYKRLGPNSHEKLLSWPTAKYVLRDIGTKQEQFQGSESKDPIRSGIESRPESTLHEQKKIVSSSTVIQSSSYNLDQPKTMQYENSMNFQHPSKTAEIAKQQQGATEEISPVTNMQTTTPKGDFEIGPFGKNVHEPSASVITPLSTSHPPRLPEPIYHAVRGSGGIKAYHIGMQDDSIIEIPTSAPEGKLWWYKPEEHTEGTELSAQQSDEGEEQQASPEPELHEEQATKDDNDVPNESQNENDDDHENNENGTNSNNDEDNAFGNQNDDNNASEANKTDNNNESDTKQNDNNQSDGHNGDDTGKGNENEYDAAKPDNNEEPEDENDNEKEDDEDKSNNNSKPDFDEWFKESPYKVDDKDDYNVDWDDSRPKVHVPFSKEWHKELGGMNDEFKDDKDHDDDGVGKHVEKLFDDDKGHDAYPDINTEPPPPGSEEEGQGDENEAENKETSEQDQQQDKSAQNSPSNEDNRAASPEEEEKDKANTTDEANNDEEQSSKEDEDGSNAAEENLSPVEDDPKAKKGESAEPTSNEEPTSADEPKRWESSESIRPANKKLQEESVQEVPSHESGGTENEDGYDPAGYEKPGDEQDRSDEAGTEESQQSPKRAKVEDAFWSDNDDFGAPPGAKIRVVEHDTSFGDMDDVDDDHDLTSQEGKRTTRRGKTPDNLSITTTNSQIRSKGFDTGVNKRRAISHRNKARPVVENIDTTSSGEDMDGDFATNPKTEVLHPDYGNTSLLNKTNVTKVR